jgi:hypothetical protein
MVSGPLNIGGPLGRRQTDQKLIVAGIRHYLIRDQTGLDRLDAVAETRER